MNIWNNIATKINTEGLKEKKIISSNTPEYLLQFLAEIISAKTKKKVVIDIYDTFDTTQLIDQKELEILVGESLDVNIFTDLGYKRVERVWNVNEYSILGDIVVFWPEGESSVVRLSTFDNKIEEISFLDPETRRYISKVERYKILKRLDTALSRVSSNSGYDEILRYLYFRNEKNINIDTLDLGIRAFPSVTSRQVESAVSSYIKQGFDIYTPNESLKNIESITFVNENINRGFVISGVKVAVLTEFEYLGKINLNDRKTKKGDEIFKQISKGDYIVHEDHGIGIYEDLVVQNGVTYLNIAYAKKDRLLVPLSSADKLTKYVGAGKSKPVLTGLNSGVWSRIKSKAKEDIERIAKELVRLYALRSVTKRKPYLFTFEDQNNFDKFVASFKHNDTEDQEVITNQIISDMQRDIPMDRLIVGDVGFGKTELAARAIFIAVSSGKQAVLLTPTTILSLQHFNVLKERFKDWPFKIALLNRYITGKEREKILEDMRDKKVDIVVGTHTLLSEHVDIPNMSILVVDEEQKFGVSQKELLKNKRMEVDVLSITATPIPRTLNMAISGIRDLSILASVPSGRKPIENKFSEYNLEEVKKAIIFEIERGGQVYYMHNRVANLPTIKDKLQEILPNITFDIIHGQLSERVVTNVMNKFINGETQVLICSSIIENGLDIPNVNTIIIDDAQRYGLSSLYQIRGRVGRSDRQAYAYIMYSQLKGRANLRIDALYEASNIGSGFILSNRDLEIRGTGNILGKAQSGAINSMGYALYTQILSTTVAKLQDRNYLNN